MANFGFVSGNLAAAPRILTNKDGSRKVFMSIYSSNDFPNRNGQYESEVVSVEAFVPQKRSARIYEVAGKGDAVEVRYTAGTDKYTDAGGKTVYTLKLRAQQTTFAPRSKTKKNVAEPVQAPQQQANTQAQAQAPQVEGEAATMADAVV